MLFRTKLDRAIEIILTTNLGVKEDETFLIIHDKSKEKLAERFEHVANMFAKKVKKALLANLKVNGQEPTAKVASLMKSVDAGVILTSKSISHTKARREATKKGVRLGSLPGITETILRRSIDIDYARMKKDADLIGGLLSKAERARITTQLGTDISFSIKGRKAHGLASGIFTHKGGWGNLPEGEVFVAPVEKTAKGVFVVDGSAAGIGKVSHPMIFFVEKGEVVKVTNGVQPAKMEQMMDAVGPKARNIAEFGIGLNRKAKVTGVVLEDEKAYGTCHIAMGNNIGFGGKVDVPFHVDCVMKKPSIWLDDQQIMRKGKMLV